MDVPSIPQKLADWNIDVLEKLLKIKDIESESFDFKREIDSDDKLYNDICAMANSSGGYLVIGVAEVKTQKGFLLGFKKSGLKEGTEDQVNQSVANSVYNVEPFPNVSTKQIADDKKFYLIVKIDLEESKKPFCTRNGQFYIRVGNSNRAASRSVIVSLLQRHVVTTDDRRSHTNYLIPILKQLSALAAIQDRKFNVTLQVPDNYKNYYEHYRRGLFGLFNRDVAQKYPYSYVNLNHINHIDWVISHLHADEYSTINQQIDRVMEIVQVYNENLASVYHEIDGQITSFLRERFPDFTIDRLYAQRMSDKYIDMDKLLKFFIVEVKNLPQYSSPIKFRALKKYQSEYDTSWYLAGEETGTLMYAPSEEELDSDKLIEILDTVYNDENLLQKFDKLKLENEIEKITKQLRKNLESLVTDLEGGELIKGYCKLGY